MCGTLSGIATVQENCPHSEISIVVSKYNSILFDKNGGSGHLFVHWFQTCYSYVSAPPRKQPIDYISKMSAGWFPEGEMRGEQWALAMNNL